MKYKVGDKVRVRRDLEERYSPVVREQMAEMKGKTLTIRASEGPYGYKVHENPWHWTDDMLEPIDSGRFPHIDEITSSLGLKEGDKILVNGAEYTVGVLGLINDKRDYANLKSILGQSFKILPKPKTGAEILAHLKELRGDWEPDWEDDNSAKRSMVYEHDDNKWASNIWWGREVIGTLFFSETTYGKVIEYLNSLTEEESMNLLKEMRI